MRIPSRDVQNFILNIMLCLTLLTVIAEIIYTMVHK
jgi:hypothetical protein